MIDQYEAIFLQGIGQNGKMQPKISTNSYKTGNKEMVMHKFNKLVFLGQIIFLECSYFQYLLEYM